MRKKILFLLPLLIVFFLVFLYFTNSTKVIDVEIAHQYVDCNSKDPFPGITESRCLYIKEQGSDRWMIWRESIKGFTYEPGYTYLLKVKREELKNPPADGSSIKYTLIKVISKTFGEGEKPAPTPPVPPHIQSKNELIKKLKRAYEIQSSEFQDDYLLISHYLKEEGEAGDTGEKILTLYKRADTNWEKVYSQEIPGKFTDIGTYIVSPQKDTILFTIIHTSTGCYTAEDCAALKQAINIANQSTGVWKYAIGDTKSRKVKSITSMEGDTPYSFLWLSDTKVEIKAMISYSDLNKLQEVTFILEI